MKFGSPLCIAVVFIAFAGLSMGQTLRISKVAEQESPETERMVMAGKKGAKEGEQALFVNKVIEISDKDVESAMQSAAQSGTLDIKLTKDGGDKFIKLTKEFRPGHDRLALIVEGRLISAPVVQQVPLGSQFQISGLDDLNNDQLYALARKISGQPPEDTKKSYRTPVELKPKFKYVPFTEEEYQSIKAGREKRGIYYLDRMPNEEELDGMLRKGMSEADVIGKLGHPHRRTKGGDDKLLTIYYEIAPEKRPDISPGQTSHLAGIQVRLEEGKVSFWGSASRSNAPREQKIVGAEVATLKIIEPPIDLSADDVDIIAYFEGFRVAEPDHKMNKTDFWTILGLARATSSSAGDLATSDQSTIKIDCDMMRLLAKHFPEIDQLVKQAKDGKVRAADLKRATNPYMMGEKPLPIGGVPAR